MSAPTDERSPILRFLDAFFQERSIKWMLGIGILTLLGSSLMLVTAHWDHYTPVWKYLTLLGYTAGIHGLGQLGYHSLALRRTGTGLMMLTVLLIPLTFLGLHWVHPTPLVSWNILIGQLGLLCLLAVNAVFSMLAARRIFRHFLCRTQPTFVVSYGLLALAGAIVPALPASVAPSAAVLLRGLFAVGAVKVNRHVFWLTEEHRLPRVYGFFPILLLGGMFLTLFAASLAQHLPLTWIGFGLVMTAIPVLLTADALANVYQQRNVAIPTQLPWSIVLPIFIGLCMTVVGVCLSGVGFPATLSLPPTAALAAIVMGVTARRTRQSAFVWLMLAAVLTAYQTSPVFFQEMARQAVQQGAAAVNETRLPYAFYGLTYLPLLLMLSGISATLLRRNERLFSMPLQRASIGLGLLLLLTSITHAKAVFPVGAVLTGLFGMQLVLFRDRRLLLAAVGSFVLAGAGVQTFVEQVLQSPHTFELPLLAWCVTGGLLLWPGRVVDRRTRTMCESAPWWQTTQVCQWASLTVLVVTGAVWLAQAGWFGSVATATGLLCGILLLVHAWLLRHRQVAQLAVGYLVLLIAALASHAGWSFSAVAALESLVLFGLWTMGRNVRRLRSDAIVDVDQIATGRIGSADILRLASADIALTGLGGIAVLFALPAMLHTILTGALFSDWIVGVVSLIWAMDVAWRRQSPSLTVVGWVLSLCTLGVLAAELFGWSVVFSWYPSLGTLLPILAISVLRRDDVDRHPLSRVDRVFRVCVVTTLVIISVASLPVLTVPMRVAGAAGVAGLLWSAFCWRHPVVRTTSLSVACWQGLAAVVQFTSPDVHAIDDLSLPLATATALPVALAAALFSVIWRGDWLKRLTVPGWCQGQSVAFRVVAIASLLNTVLQFRHGLLVWETGLAATLFLLLTCEQLWTARLLSADRRDDSRSLIRRRDAGEPHVWQAEAITAAGIGYFLLMRVLTLGGTISLFAPLLLGIALWCVGRLSLHSDAWSVLSRPLLRTGLILPVLTVVVGVARDVSMRDTEWLGINSLALLLAAGFYFWQGLEKRTSSLLIASATILNIASTLLWWELSYTDPQFFMIPIGLCVLGLVELLRPQINSRYVDPLRYVGALMILVSPTFHIVEGSWFHLLTLMVASVLIALTAIGLRVRALMYTGTAFLAADIVAMVVRGSIDNTSLLWIAGILVGAAVIGLAAYCERHREQMLQRIRVIATELETWD